MALVTVTLRKFVYGFRPPTWRDYNSLLEGKEDVRRALLSRVLSEVSGNPVQLADAKRIISTLPETVISRVWAVYNSSLPLPSFYTTQSLYQAPEAALWFQQARAEADRAEAAIPERDDDHPGPSLPERARERMGG